MIGHESNRQIRVVLLVLTIIIIINVEVQFLFQRISVLIQRFNSVLFYETFSVEDDTDI